MSTHAILTNGEAGAAHAIEPALPASAGRMPERSRHRASEGQDARSERPVEMAWAAPAGTNHLRRFLEPSVKA